MLSFDRRRMALIGLLIALLIGFPPVTAQAGFRLYGAGGCGNLDEALARAQPGDVVAAMIGFRSSNSIAPITQSLVLEGGWVPNFDDSSTARCEESGNDQPNSSTMYSLGYTLDPDQGSELSLGSGNHILPFNLNGATVVLKHLDLTNSVNTVGGVGIQGTLANGARMRIENLEFNDNLVQGGVANGAAIRLELTGNSHLTIINSRFNRNQAGSGGAIELVVRDGSTVVIENSSFANNEALNGSGGAVRIIMYAGTVVLRSNSFTGNVATNGSGGAIRIERAATATGSTVVLIDGNQFSGNSAASAPDSSFSGVSVMTPRVRVPLTLRQTATTYRVQLLNVTISDAQYLCTFTTSGYTPQLPGRHIHFFFNTVTESQAGVPANSANWFVYGSSAPFTGYNIKDRPPGATALCALVANADHTVIPGTGGCIPLP